MKHGQVALLAAALCVTVGAASAADLRQSPVREPRAAAPDWAPEPEKHILVEVEGLYLRSGCPADRDCLPPRVLAVPSTRSVDLITLSIPVDPRFNDRYR